MITIILALFIGLLLGFEITVVYILLHNTIITESSHLTNNYLDIYEELQVTIRRLNLVETRILEGQRTRFNDIYDKLSDSMDCIVEDRLDSNSDVMEICDYLKKMVDIMEKNEKLNGENSQGV